MTSLIPLLEYFGGGYPYAWIGATNGDSHSALFHWMSDGTVVTNATMSPGEPNTYIPYWGLTVYMNNMQKPGKRIGDSPGYYHVFPVVCEAVLKGIGY